MNGPKIVVIGAGSYTFGFTMLHDAVIDHRLDGAEMHLVDRDLEMAQGYARIGERIAREHGVRMRFAATDDRVKALDGADFVTTSIAVDLKTRAATDWRIALKHGILQTQSECGSVGGLSYTMRSVPLVLGVCRDMERLCPKATLLNVTNPLTRVVLAAGRYSSIKTVGFCYVALVGRRLAAWALMTDPSELDVTFAGLNHFTWLLDIRDKKTGRDLYGDVRAAAEKGFYPPLVRKYLRETGYLAGPGDDHMGEFVPFDRDLSVGQPEFGHGTPAERTERRAQVLRVAAGEDRWQYLHHAWERPMDYVNAVVRDKVTRFDFLNVPNNGSIPGLPEDMIVEVPADVDASGARAVTLPPLPQSILRMLEPVAETCHWAVEAAVKGDLAAAHKAIDADPAVAAADKGAARAAFAEMLVAHGDILDRWRR
jgi:alpha-galactosidase/6-phospho-beta-glucosidase family protein